MVTAEINYNIVCILSSDNSLTCFRLPFSKRQWTFWRVKTTRERTRDHPHRRESWRREQKRPLEWVYGKRSGSVWESGGPRASSYLYLAPSITSPSLPFSPTPEKWSQNYTAFILSLAWRLSERRSGRGHNILLRNVNWYHYSLSLSKRLRKWEILNRPFPGHISPLFINTSSPGHKKRKQN